MTFLRPAVARLLSKWREALLWSAFLVITVHFAVRAFLAAEPVSLVISLAFAFVFSVLIYLAVIRISLRPIGRDPGLVRIRERQLVYFGPEERGSISLDDLWRVDVRVRTETEQRAARLAYILISRNAEVLEIPGSAEGMEKVLENLTALPEFRADRLARLQRSTVPAQERIWQRN